MKAQSLIVSCILGIFFLGIAAVSAQDRISHLSQMLDSMAVHVSGLDEVSTISLRDVTVSEYVRAIGMEHKVNLYIPDTPDKLITSNLVNEPVKSVLLFVCKKYDFNIEVTGTILEFVPYVAPPAPEPLPEPPPTKPVLITFSNGLLSVDLRKDSLYRVIRTISTLTGKKIIYPPGTDGLITAFLPPTPLDTALEALFLANDYKLKSRKKGYYVLTSIAPPIGTEEKGGPSQTGRLDFEVEAYTDGIQEYLRIQAENADLSALIKAIFEQVESDFLIYDQIEGSITIDADITTLEDVLSFLLQGTEYTYKVEGGLYMLGKKSLDGLMTTRVVKMHYRPTNQAVDLIPGNTQSSSSSGTGIQTSNQSGNNRPTIRRNPEAPQRSGQSYGGNPAYQNGSYGNPYGNYGSNGGYGGYGNYGGYGGYGSYGSGGYATVSAPPEISKIRVGEVEIVEYPELNRLILKGPTDEVNLIADYLAEIDRPVPMVKVEMIVVEINKNRILTTGVKAGIRQAEDSSATPKAVLPGIDYTLDGSELNAIMGKIPALANLGTLSSNFYLQLKAQETRGNLRMRMSPVLSMLNGREASLTIGQTQYYLLETQTASTGAVNNFQTFTQRFERIEANITLTVKPYISEDEMVTLDVIPDFTTPVGQFDSGVPPTIATRRFVSTIRVKNGETVILGGLSEDSSHENTSGLPVLSRIPILKWLFGNVNKNKSKSSLFIYLTPVIYYN